MTTEILVILGINAAVALFAILFFQPSGTTDERPEKSPDDIEL